VRRGLERSQKKYIGKGGGVERSKKQYIGEEEVEEERKSNSHVCFSSSSGRAMCTACH
jgi:hypothetical protein